MPAATTPSSTWLAVRSAIGMIDALMAEAKRQSVTCVCLFTRIPEFFGKLGFRAVEKEALPDKIHKDCLKCPRLHACDEIAMYRGTLPRHLSRGNFLPQQKPLVQIASH